MCILDSFSEAYDSQSPTNIEHFSNLNFGFVLKET